MFPKLFKEKKLSLCLFLILSILTGIGAWLKIPLEAMPRENAENFLYLNVGSKQVSSPVDQEKRLALPLEGIIRTLEGISSYKTSINQNSVSMSLSYNSKINMDRAYFDLLQSLQKLEELNILEMKQVSITRLNPEAQALMKLSISGKIDESQLKKIIDSDLRGQIESIPGVAKVEFSGIEVDSTVMNLSNLSIKNLRLNKDLMAKRLDGRIQNYAIGIMSTTYNRLLPLNATLERPTQNDYLQTNLAEKSYVPLSEVGFIESQDKKGGGTVAHKNLEKAIFVELFAKDGADLFLIQERLNGILESFKKRGIVLELLMDKVNDLKDSLDDVKMSLFMSILLTTIIVPIFLRQLTPALIIASVIPISTLWTIVLMFVVGKTLNLLTLSGLILSVGMVVDNGIIVMEKIQQLLDEGLDKVSAAARSAQDVFWPLLISTLTNASIFIPPTFIEGADPFTDMLKSFRDPIVFSLITSFFSSLLVIPLLSLFFDVGVDKNFKRTNFNSLFSFLYSKRVLLLMPIFLGLIISITPIKNLQESDIESPRDPFVSLKVKFSSDISPLERKEHFLNLEKMIARDQTNIPFKLILAEFNPLYLNGSFSIFPFEGNNDLELDRLQAYIDKMTAEYETPPGMVLGDVFNFSIDPRPKFNLKFIAPDAKALEVLMTDLKENVDLKGLVDQIKNDAEESDSHGAFFNVSQEKLIRNKLSVTKISSSFSTGDKVYGEIPAFISQRETILKVMTPKEFDHWTLDLWGQYMVPVDEKVSVQLSNLGEWLIRPQLNSIRRENGTTSGRLHFYLPEGQSLLKDKVREKIMSSLSRYDFREGQGLAKDSSALNIEKARKNSLFIIGLSVFLIFILLAAMFESIRIPLAIMTSVPMAVIFGLLGLSFFNLPLDPMARLGLIILTGIAVNNSIVLVDVFNEWRARGFKRSEAIIKGCSQRFISILMSTACNVAGVLPVALGQGKIMGIPYASMGIVIMTGLIGSTIVTLIMLPAIYEFLEDFGQRQGTAEVSGAKSYPM
jgi:HAE1 family hydrophobic/amphiphilic exporter-1